MARETSPAVIRILDEWSKVVRAVSGFLETVADLLRQLAHVVGWLVLLIGSPINMLLDPHLSIGHLIVPGVGSLAVLQGLIKPRQPCKDADAATPSAHALLAKTDPVSDVGALHGCTSGTGEEHETGNAA